MAARFSLVISSLRVSSSCVSQQVREDVMRVSIERLSVEPGCPLAAREDISGYFVEFQLLDYDYGELETPSVLVSPHSSQPIFFNFTKGL